MCNVKDLQPPPTWLLGKVSDTTAQIHKYKYTKTNTQKQVHKYEYTYTNTQTQIHIYTQSPTWPLGKVSNHLTRSFGLSSPENIRSSNYLQSIRLRAKNQLTPDYCCGLMSSTDPNNLF